MIKKVLIYLKERKSEIPVERKKRGKNSFLKKNSSLVRKIQLPGIFVLHKSGKRIV